MIISVLGKDFVVATLVAFRRTTEVVTTFSWFTDYKQNERTLCPLINTQYAIVLRVRHLFHALLLHLLQQLCGDHVIAPVLRGADDQLHELMMVVYLIIQKRKIG